MINYDPHKWTDHLFDVKGSMVREIFGRTVAVVAWSALVTGFHLYVRPVGVPVSLHSLTGLALSLLLVFRTNSANDRFWEGRKAWGGLVNESRNLARALRAFTPPNRADLCEPLVLWLGAFAPAVMHSLRGERGLGGCHLRLPEPAATRALDAPHTALAVAGHMSDVLAHLRRENQLSDYQAVTLDGYVQRLVDNLGICERIARTPLPFAYVVHLRRALLLFCLTLPFALVESFGWCAVLGVFIVTYIFFGIEEIGVEIEDPFGTDDNDLPLEAICQTIERDILATLGETSEAIKKNDETLFSNGADTRAPGNITAADVIL